MAANLFARMYSISRLPLYRVPLPAAQFLTVGRTSGSSEERSFHPDNLHFARDAPASAVRVANKSAAFRKLIGAPVKAPKVSVTNMDSFGAKLRHRLGHGYAKVKAVTKVVEAANNAERNADAAADAAADATAAADAAEFKQELESESPRGDFVILPESRYKYSNVESSANFLPTPAGLRRLLSAFRGESSNVSEDDLEKLKGMFKFDGSPDDMQAFVAAFVQHKLSQANEDISALYLPLEAMNRNSRMPKAANHVSHPCAFYIHALLFLPANACSGQARCQSMAPSQEEN
jgi:hypothetical protein